MEQMKGEFNGIYRAYVAGNKDPYEMGRIQIRVPFLHGIIGNDFTAVADKDLPYAMPCFPSASYDSGSFLVPEVGSIVFVFFENGDCDEPIYFGQCYGKADDETIKYYGYPDSNIYKDSKGKKQKRACIDETPSNVYKNGIINRFILWKSPKGQSIEINDNDEEESINIYDRNGQTFSMSSPETSKVSAHGMRNRGVFSVLKEKFTRSVNKTSIIILKALSGSKLRFVSNRTNSKTDLICVYNDEKAGVSISIGSGNRVLVFFGDSKFEIKEGSVNVDTSTFNVNAGTINLDAGSINSSSKIHVGGASASSVSSYRDSNEESKIK